MLRSISWGECIEVTWVMAALYYLVIGGLYYRKELVGVFKGQRLGNPGANTKLGMVASPPPANTVPQDFALTEQIVAEIKRVIKKVTDDRVAREDLLGSIAHILESYTHLENTAFGKAINHFIIHECEKNYSVHLSEDEVRKLWGE